MSRLSASPGVAGGDAAARARPAEALRTDMTVPQEPGSRGLGRALLRPAIAVLSALLLALVFVAYLRPDFALDLANRFVLCL